jgi:hypothetical protein
VTEHGGLCCHAEIRQHLISSPAQAKSYRDTISIDKLVMVVHTCDSSYAGINRRITVQDSERKMQDPIEK